MFFVIYLLQLEKQKQKALQTASLPVCTMDVFVWPWILPTILIAVAAGDQALVGGLFVLFQALNLMAVSGT